MSGAMPEASWPTHSGAISSSIARCVTGTASNPKASPQPSIPWSVVTFTSRESTAGRSFWPQADAADLIPGLNGMRSGNVSILAMIMTQWFRGSSSGSTYRRPSGPIAVI